MNTELSSIWDGWEKQCYFAGDTPDGHECAVHFARRHHTESSIAYTYARVAAYIRTHYTVPESYTYTPANNSAHYEREIDTSFEVVVWANNVLKLQPEQFRQIDRLTTVDEVVRPLLNGISAEIAAETDRADTEITNVQVR